MFRNKKVVSHNNHPIPNLIVPIKEYQNYPYTKSLDDITHSDYKIQIWGVDESRNPSFNGMFDYYILSSVNLRSVNEIEDLLLQTIEQFGDVKFNTLYKQDYDAAISTIKGIIDSKPTVIYQVYKKQEQNDDAKNYSSRSIMYTALRTLRDKIQRTSDADLIFLFVDDNDFLDFSDYYRLSNKRTIIRPVRNDISPSVQVADIMAGSLGLYLNPKKPNAEPYNLIKDSVKGTMPYGDTQSPYGLTHSKQSTSKNKKPSNKKPMETTRVFKYKRKNGSPPSVRTKAHDKRRFSI